ncbi:MAG: VWA domain-containing protein, partial [Fimbriiglobus sp.]|nr:VWA domain-containing protein [Fimbriiglobus sp.]
MHSLRPLAALLLFAAITPAADPAKPAPTTKPVDLVICLDCSGSMNGLLDSARLKLWDVVNELAKIKPTPVLRVAVYSYGGQGADYPPAGGYIRKEIDLTTDLDAVYEKLSALKTTGHVELATGVAKQAIGEQKWSDDKGALKLVFVCGNEEADQDKATTYDALGKLAKEKGVIVNSIYCGPAADGIAPGWKTLAELGGGKFANIDMNKATQLVIATPFDKELAELSGKLNTTYVAYGKEGKEKAQNQLKQDENAVKAASGAGGVANAAARAEAKGGVNYRNDSWDLLDRMKADPKFDVKSLKDDELPDELKKLKPEEREGFLKKKAEERADIQKKIADLSAKRN